MTSGNPAYVSALSWVAGPEGRPPCQRGAGRGEMATGRPGVPRSRAGQEGERYKDCSGNVELPVFHLFELEYIGYLFSPCGFDGPHCIITHIFV